MAKVRKNPASGKQGTTVSYKTPYGQAERDLSVPANPRSNAQVRVRTALSRSSARWRTLTDEQRSVWINGGSQVKSESRLGQSGHLTGCQFFNKINCTLALTGEPPTDVPTERPNFGVNPVGALTATNDGGEISLKLSVSRAPTQYILVLGTAPCSAGMAVPRRFVILGRLPDPVARVCDITDLYVARYGVPPVGTRVFIRTVQVANGWEDFPKDTTAVVPGK
ncbi:MAG: hypothetical protein ACLQU3_32895 [Limisphaerales bacterium]